MKDYNADEVQKRMNEAVQTALESNPFGIADNKLPEIYCRNCGRSVYVGRCCPAPDIQGVERPDPEIMKKATEYADATVIRGNGEPFGSYFLRKVRARREKAEELKGITALQSDVIIQLQQPSVPPRGKELTVDYVKVREGKSEMMDRFNEAREKAEAEGTVKHVPLNVGEPMPWFPTKEQMDSLTTSPRFSGSTVQEIRARLDAGQTIGLILCESEIDVEKYRTMIAKAQKNPTILSPESFDKVVDMINNPGEPSPALVELMKRPRVAVKCGGRKKGGK